MNTNRSNLFREVLVDIGLVTLLALIITLTDLGHMQGPVPAVLASPLTPCIPCGPVAPVSPLDPGFPCIPCNPHDA